MSQYDGSPSNHMISRIWHLVEHTPSILINAPTFCIHVHQVTPTKTSDSQPLWMIWSWTPLPSSRANYAGTCIQHPHKSNRAWVHTFLLYLLQLFQCLLPCPHCTCPNIMVIQVTTFQDGILLNTLKAPKMLPNFAYMSTKLLHTKTSDSQPLWMSCIWTSIPSSSVPKLAHALIIVSKILACCLFICARCGSQNKLI